MSFPRKVMSERTPLFELRATTVNSYVDIDADIDINRCIDNRNDNSDINDRNDSQNLNTDRHIHKFSIESDPTSSSYNRISSNSEYQVEIAKSNRYFYFHTFLLISLFFITLLTGLLYISHTSKVDETDYLNASTYNMLTISHNTYTDLYEVVDKASNYRQSPTPTLSDIGMNSNSNSDKYILLATGRYIHNYDSNGWNHLSLHVEDIPKHFTSVDSIQYYVRSMAAIGLIEGYATCTEIKQYYVNFYAGLFDGGDPKQETIDFLRDNYAWMKEEADANYLTSEYWLSVKAILAQIEGMLEGIRRGCPGYANIDDDNDDNARIGTIKLQNLSKYPSMIHLLLLNANGDLYQIAAKYNQQNAPPSRDDDADDDPTSGSSAATSAAIRSSNIVRKLSKHSLNRKRRHFTNNGDEPDRTLTTEGGIDVNNTKGSRETGVDHCSVIIKLLADKSDIMFGHNTWDDFQSLYPRIFKHYSHPLIENGVQVNRYDLHFSSSPGFLTSVDDFFVVSGKGNLAITETTIDLYDAELLKLIEPQSMLSWTRSRLSNVLAADGQDWVDIFSMYHSGTYDNQWMIMDFNKFTAGANPEPGFLTVAEEIPGYIHSADVTQDLIDNSYWASYNNPYFDDISVLSGNDAFCKINEHYCHDGDPRAKIFRERQDTVVDIPTLKLLLGYNKFQTDPLSENDSCNAISCRQDLEPIETNQYPFGATDAKCSSVLLAQEGPLPIIFARLGPTHDDQIPFCWQHFDDQHYNARGKRFSHEGHPECFDFEWVVMPPNQ